MEYVEEQFRNASIVVPYVVNDDNDGNFAPGSGLAAVDIYGIDAYPLGFDCANPNTWPAGALQTDLTSTHEEYSPLTPFSFIEFQVRGVSALPYLVIANSLRVAPLILGEDGALRNASSL